MRRVALVFPGQGTQYKDMGLALVAEHEEAKEAFARASEAAALDVEALCADREALESHTALTQVAILTHSVAAYRVYRARIGLIPSVFAGHSVGEYAALVAAGALAFEDAVRLVRRRGELMAEASRGQAVGMVALEGIGLEDAESLCRAVGTAEAPVHVACHNGPGQLVVGGSREGLDRLLEEPPRGVKASRLKVAGAFHTPTLAAALGEFREVLDETPVQAPKAPVLSNVTAAPHGAAAEIRSSLAEQLVSPVRWAEIVDHLEGVAGVSAVVELGPRQVLGNLVRRAYPGTFVGGLSNPATRAALEDEFRNAGYRLPAGNVVGRILGEAVATPNRALDPQGYRLRVIEPYRELEALQQDLDAAGRLASVGEAGRALGDLDAILAAKGAHPDERRRRLERALAGTNLSLSGLADPGDAAGSPVPETAALRPDAGEEVGPTFTTLGDAT